MRLNIEQYKNLKGVPNISPLGIVINKEKEK